METGGESQEKLGERAPSSDSSSLPGVVHSEDSVNPLDAVFLHPSFHTLRCARPLPVEPLYDLQLAAALIPTTYTGLKAYLQRYRKYLPSRYRLDYKHRRHRLLYASEIAFIRSKLLRGDLRNLVGGPGTMGVPQELINLKGDW